MASPQTETWWSNFLDVHGRDGEEEAAFLGFMLTHKVPAWAPPDQLQASYDEFRGFMKASHERGDADPGPDAAELARQEAVVALLHRPVPQSRTAVPYLEKPSFAATRPPETLPTEGEGAPPQFATMEGGHGVGQPTPPLPPGTPPPPGAQGAPAPGEAGAPRDPDSPSADDDPSATQSRYGRRRTGE
jgi:hypothetical protein